MQSRLYVIEQNIKLPFKLPIKVQTLSQKQFRIFYIKVRSNEDVHFGHGNRI